VKLVVWGFKQLVSPFQSLKHGEKVRGWCQRPIWVPSSSALASAP